MKNSDRLVRIGSSGMRGVVGDGLAISNVSDFACAFAMLQEKNSCVLVARDNRKSSKMFYDAVVAALISMGLEVVLADILNAGMLHYIIKHNSYSGGILISGGHQSENWNAIIPFNKNGEYFNNIELRELFDIYHSKMFNYSVISEIKKSSKMDEQQIVAYFDYLKTFFDIEAIRKAKFRVIIDCCDGSGSKFVDCYRELWGAELIEVNTKLDSDSLPRNPAPNKNTGRFVGSVIKDLKCDIGFVFNSDMSRVSLVMEDKEVLSEEMTFPIALDYILANNSDIKYVMTNICSSKTIDDIVENYQRTLIKTGVAQANLIEKIKLYNSYLAGEGSGSFIFGEDIVGFDAIFMATLILEYLAKSNKKISQLYQKLPNYHMEKMVVPSQKLHTYAKLRALKNIFGNDCEVSELDGIRFDFSDGFVSMRVAGTEKIIRLISESSDEKTAIERIWFAKSKLESE